MWDVNMLSAEENLDYWNGPKMKYRQEYELYADYALERYLIEKEGYNEYDAKVKVMQDYDEVKKWFEETEKISLSPRID